MKFDATAGLSLGEFTALTAAGAMSFEDGLRVVRQRGRFMQEACDVTKGGMAAIIGLDEAPTREVCAEAGVVLANLNCPGQLVISGEAEKIAKACELAKAKGAKRAMPLHGGGRVSLAAHGQRAAEAGGGTGENKNFCADCAGDFKRDGAAARRRDGNFRATRRAGLASVLWEHSMRVLLAQGFTRFIELGPGTALSGFMKRIDKTAQMLNVADAASLEATVKVLTS